MFSYRNMDVSKVKGTIFKKREVNLLNLPEIYLVYFIHPTEIGVFNVGVHKLCMVNGQTTSYVNKVLLN